MRDYNHRECFVGDRVAYPSAKGFVEAVVTETFINGAEVRPRKGKDRFIPAERLLRLDYLEDHHENPVTRSSIRLRDRVAVAGWWYGRVTYRAGIVIGLADSWMEVSWEDKPGETHKIPYREYDRVVPL